MTSQFIEEFSFLLDSGRDGIEVSYNAAGVLAHIASDGPEVWTMMMMMMMIMMMTRFSACSACPEVQVSSIPWSRSEEPIQNM